MKYQQLQLRSIEQCSTVVGTIIAYLIVVVVAFVGLIFTAIAFAAWLEQWLPMWATYLIIAGGIMLMGGMVYLCRKTLFIRPIRKILKKSLRF